MSDKEPGVYLGIYDGIVQAVAVDFGDKGTADFLAEIVMDGGRVERSTLEIGRRALGKSWPLS